MRRSPSYNLAFWRHRAVNEGEFMGPLEVCLSLSAIAVAVCRVPFRCLCPCCELNSQMSNSKAREPEGGRLARRRWRSPSPLSLSLYVWLTDINL